MFKRPVRNKQIPPPYRVSSYHFSSNHPLIFLCFDVFGLGVVFLFPSDGQKRSFIQMGSQQRIVYGLWRNTAAKSSGPEAGGARQVRGDGTDPTSPPALRDPGTRGGRAGSAGPSPLLGRDMPGGGPSLYPVRGR